MCTCFTKTQFVDSVNLFDCNRWPQFTRVVVFGHHGADHNGLRHAACLCWLAFAGPFPYSTKSPSMSVSRFVVAAMFNGSPADIAAENGMVAVIDGNVVVSHLTTFSIDEDRNS